MLIRVESLVFVRYFLPRTLTISKNDLHSNNSVTRSNKSIQPMKKIFFGIYKLGIHDQKT